eukprot:EG_transcript_1622
MVTEHTVADVPMTYTEDCDPQFEAWAQEGYDLILGSLPDTWCLERLATLYPNTTFSTISGFNGDPPNYAPIWVRFYQATYLAGYTAALVTKTKKICVSASVRFSIPVMDITGFCRGIHSADPSVEIHLLETGQMGNPLLDVWNVNQSFAIGCDVVFAATMDTAACLQASRLGMMSVGFFSDARLAIGELVITSVWVDHVPLFVRLAEAIIGGTFAQDKQRADWWMGWDRGGLVLADPSFLVPANVTARVQAQTANLSRVFCGQFCTSQGCLCNTSSCCVSDEQLWSLDAYPDFVVEHGVLQLPGRACGAGQLGTWHIDNFTMVCSDCPAGTYAYNADQVSECRPCPVTSYSLAGSTNCTPCASGTYNDREGQGQCWPCVAGSIAINPGAAMCNVCPSGMSNRDRTECTAASLLWLAGVGGGLALGLLLVGAWAWWASRKMRRLQKQFSNDHVAVECAAAIARLDLQAVAWLSDIPRPNCIQLSFIRIVRILDEVRKYVPDQLLQSLACGDEEHEEEPPEKEGEEEGLAEAEEGMLARPRLAVEDCPESQRMSDQPDDCKSMTLGVPIPGVPGPAGPVTVRPQQPSIHAVTSSSRPSIASSKGHGPQRLFTLKKVTYLLVQFNMNQHRCSIGNAEDNINLFLGHLVETAKAQGGTLGTVAYDRAVVHWGTTKRAVAEAPMKAVETAMALTSFTSKLHGGAVLNLNIAIGCGNTVTGVVETATNHFFVVGGGEVPLVESVAARDWHSILGVQLLVSATVRASVQYSYLCHPRLVEGEEVLWEPVTRKCDKGEDEWMYQLQQDEEVTALTPDLLLSPFLALSKGDRARSARLAQELLERHGPNLSRADVAALQRLAIGELDYEPQPLAVIPASNSVDTLLLRK